jgi:hypothetical protein
MQDGTDFVDLQDVFKVAIDQSSTTGVYVNSAHMSWLDRRKEISETVNKGQHELVQRAAVLYERVSAVRGEDVKLRPEELKLLGLPEDTEIRSLVDLLTAVRSRWSNLTSAASSLLVTPRDSDGEEVGRVKLELERQVIALEALVGHAMQQAVTAHDYGGLGGIGHPVFKFENMPAWVRAKLVVEVQAIDPETALKATLEQLERLRGFLPTGNAPISLEAVGDLDSINKVVAPALARLKAIRHREEDEEQERRKKAQEEKRQSTHEWRITILPDVAFDAARRLGMEHFTKLLSERDFPRADVAVDVPKEEPFPIPLGAMEKSRSFHTAMSGVRSYTDNQLSLLTRLGVMMEQPEVFAQIVGEVIKMHPRDWTGFYAGDYQDDTELSEQWSMVLRQIVAGYAVGAIEAACTVSDDEISTAAQKRKISIKPDQFRQVTMQQAMSVLFGETDFLQGVKSNPPSFSAVQQQYAQELGKMMQRMQRIDISSQQRFSSFLADPGNFDKYAKLTTDRQREAHAGLADRDLRLALQKGLYEEKLGKAHTRVQAIDELDRRRVPAWERINAIKMLQTNLPEAALVVSYKNGRLAVRTDAALDPKIDPKVAAEFIEALQERITGLNNVFLLKDSKLFGLKKSYCITQSEFNRVSLELPSSEGNLDDQSRNALLRRSTVLFGSGENGFLKLRDSVADISRTIGEGEVKLKEEQIEVYARESVKLEHALESLRTLEGSARSFVYDTLGSPRYINFAVLLFLRTNLREYLTANNVEFK